MKNLGQLMKQAQEMQDKMAEMQESLGQIEIEGVAGAGLVKLTLNGKGEMRRLRIDPTLSNPDEAEILEDLIVAAHNDAKGRLEARVQDETQKLMGGLPLPPGMKLPF
ncbi:MAG: YbaB/EbfC family nucleoid-associated protein [Rickettsiales bacterium]|nr:YbaB/EbfC family nucleoid-associated protein [Rickettsiales bacterium]|tara:strand:- start:87 stop:410 length:324 start_codon:yes stop_codon:yes gene_type:complete